MKFTMRPLQANAMINFKNDEIIVFNNTINILHANSGHYRIWLNSSHKKRNSQVTYFCSHVDQKI